MATYHTECWVACLDISRLYVEHFWWQISGLLAGLHFTGVGLRVPSEKMTRFLVNFSDFGYLAGKFSIFNLPKFC